MPKASYSRKSSSDASRASSRKSSGNKDKAKQPPPEPWPVYHTATTPAPMDEAPDCPDCGQPMTLEPRGLASLMESMCHDCIRRTMVTGGIGGRDYENNDSGSKKRQIKSKKKSSKTKQRKKSFFSFF